MAARIRSLVAFAHVADVARSIRFYADLGFRAARTVPPGGTAPVWAWLESEAARLMLGQASAPVDPSAQAVLFYLYVDDVRASHAALARPARSGIRRTCRAASSGSRIPTATCSCLRGRTPAPTIADGPATGASPRGRGRPGSTAPGGSNDA